MRLCPRGYVVFKTLRGNSGYIWAWSGKHERYFRLGPDNIWHNGLPSNIERVQEYINNGTYVLLDKKKYPKLNVN